MSRRPLNQLLPTAICAHRPEGPWWYASIASGWYCSRQVFRYAWQTAGTGAAERCGRPECRLAAGLGATHWSNTRPCSASPPSAQHTRIVVPACCLEAQFCMAHVAASVPRLWPLNPSPSSSWRRAGLAAGCAGGLPYHACTQPPGSTCSACSCKNRLHQKRGVQQQAALLCLGRTVVGRQGTRELQLRPG